MPTSCKKATIKTHHQELFFLAALETKVSEGARYKTFIWTNGVKIYRGGSDYRGGRRTFQQPTQPKTSFVERNNTSFGISETKP